MSPAEKDRIDNMLRDRREPSEEEWQWINRYLSLADKAYKKEREAEKKEQEDSQTGVAQAS